MSFLMGVSVYSWILSLLLLGARAFPQLQNIPRADAPAPAWNSCGNLIRNASAADNPLGVVPAIDVYNCWSTVPFNSAVATRFLRYWNDTLQFHSSLEYVKHPPASYQKPAVDLLAGLQQIQDAVDAGTYQSQYDFEAAFQRLMYSAGDDHLDLVAGILATFKFANPYGVTTLSLDGIALPKVYTTYDLYLNQTKNPGDTWQPSAITHYNGRDITEYMSEFAALNAGGTLEPHSDWNILMDNPVLDILQTWSNFQGYATFYPGDEFTFTFENGSSVTDNWLAIYYSQGDTGPLETGGDYYNFFVLGYYPASYEPSNATAPATSSAPAPTSFADYSIAYPAHADVAQANLTITGFTTGYFLRDRSLAVLSIPTFGMYGDAIQAFSDAVQEFVTQAKAQGMKKVVIDLQQNYGGDTILAYNTFKQFFPSITPYGGSNRRSTPLANTFGSTIDPYCANTTSSDPDFLICVSDEWYIQDLIDAETGQNFTSWPEFYGPINDGVDNFSKTQRLNTSDPVYDYAQLGYVDPPAPLFQKAGASPWAASDIIVLTDAVCSSACSLLVEFMRFDAGVKNVVVGGRPTGGPMQTPSLSRAAVAYAVDSLDADFANVQTLDPTAVVPNRYDQSVYTLWGAVSLRDQIGPNSQVPYQMEYQAADCRIYWTPSTFNNFTNLWGYAADAMWTDPSKCVQGSTGHAPTGNSTGSASAPASTVPAGVTYDPNGVVSVGGNSSAQGIPLLVNEKAPQIDALIPKIRPRTTPGVVNYPYSNPKPPAFSQTQYQDPYSQTPYQYQPQYTYTTTQQEQCGYRFLSEQASCPGKRSLGRDTISRTLRKLWLR